MVVVITLLLGSALWGLFWLPLRGLEQAGLGGFWTLTVIYLGAALTLGPLARRHWRTALRMPWRLLGIGLSAAVSNIAFGIGMIEGDVARVLILFYLSPVWTVVLGRLLLGERLLAVTIPALALALFGAGLMLFSDLQGVDAGLLPAFGTADLLGLLAGLGFALTNVQVRAAHQMPATLKNLSAVVLVPPLALLAALAVDTAPPAASFGATAMTTTAEVATAMTALATALAVALAVGALWLSTMVAATQHGVSHMPLQRSSVLLLFELIVGAVSAALLAGETLSPTELTGGACIVLAGLAIVWLRTPKTAIPQ